MDEKEVCLQNLSYLAYFSVDFCHFFNTWRLLSFLFSNNNKSMVQWFYQGQGHLQFLHNFFWFTWYRRIFQSKSPTKSLFVEKKRSKVGPMLCRKFQITYKTIVCGEKTVKIGTILSRKSSKYPSWLAMCNVYIRNELPTGLPVRFNAIQHRGDILPIWTCGDFYVSFCIDIAMSNRHVVSLGEYSDNR